MKVIFLEDLPNVAQAGEIKVVADGYARNYLLPKKLASVVRPGIEKEIAARQAKIEARLTEMADKVEGVEINLLAKAGSKERLYGAVTAADIAAELSAVTGLNIDKKRIELDRPIHQLGSYDVSVRLGKDAVPTIKVNVAREEEEAAPTAAEAVEPEAESPKAEAAEEATAEADTGETESAEPKE
jgi:large subunit ribosomal protein L9